MVAVSKSTQDWAAPVHGVALKGQRQNMEHYREKLLRSLAASGASMAFRCVDLRVAAYLARKGELDTARRIIAEIREEYRHAVVAQIFVEINYAEGVVDYFERGPAAAVDKLSRSLALTVAVGEDFGTVPLVCGWLAACYRQMGRWSDMGRMLERALSSITDLGSEGFCRTAIVVGDVLQEVAEYAEARYWYDCARRTANLLSDDTAVGAILYNRAALRLFNVRLDRGFDLGEALKEWRIDLEAASAENYTQYIGEHSIEWVFNLLKGQLKLLEGDYLHAALLLRGSEGSEYSLVGWPAVEALRNADLTLAKVRSGGFSAQDIEGEIERISAGIKSGRGLSNGDMALCFRSLAAAAHSVNAQCASRLTSVCQGHLEAHLKSRAEEARALSTVLAGPGGVLIRNRIDAEIISK